MLIAEGKSILLNVFQAPPPLQGSLIPTMCHYSFHYQTSQSLQWGYIKSYAVAQSVFNFQVPAQSQSPRTVACYHYSEGSVGWLCQWFGKVYWIFTAFGADYSQKACDYCDRFSLCLLVKNKSHVCSPLHEMCLRTIFCPNKCVCQDWITSQHWALQVHWVIWVEVIWVIAILFGNVFH